VSDEPKCTSCGVPYSAHLGIVGTCAKLTEALARIAELESRAQPAEGGCVRLSPELASKCKMMVTWAGKFSQRGSTIRDQCDALCADIEAALRAAGIAVEGDG
jgi:hypothetical protein